MGWDTALRLAATGGRADGTRIALTAVGAATGTLALLAAATVAVVGRGDGPYTSALLNQPGLHPGVVAAFVLLCVPVLAFVGQCARIGAPARDRRLAALRLSGATPRDVVRIAAGETVLSSVLGSGVGTALYFVLRAALDHPQAMVSARADRSALRLPTDVLPPWPALVAIAVAIPLAAAVFTVLALHRVTISPFGVVRREQRRPVRVLPAVLFVAGTAAMAAFVPLRRALHLDGDSVGAPAAVLFGVFLLTGIGLLWGTSAVSAAIGSLMATRTRRPSLLIAGRRLLAAPGQGARAHAALLLVVLLWAFDQGVRAWLLTDIDAGPGIDASSRSFYSGALHLVDVAFGVGAVVSAASVLVGTVEGVLTRRRVLASMTAVGTPRGVLSRAVLVETLAPLLPTALLAAAAGILGARGVFGASIDHPTSDRLGQHLQHHFTPVPVPWQDLGLLVAATLLTVLALTALTLPLLRRSAQPSELRAE